MLGNHELDGHTEDVSLRVSGARTPAQGLLRVGPGRIPEPVPRVPAASEIQAQALVLDQAVSCSPFSGSCLWKQRLEGWCPHPTWRPGQVRIPDQQQATCCESISPTWERQAPREGTALTWIQACQSPAPPMPVGPRPCLSACPSACWFGKHF